MLEPHIYKLEPHPDYIVLVCDSAFKTAYADVRLAMRVFEGLRGEKAAALDLKAEVLILSR